MLINQEVAAAIRNIRSQLNILEKALDDFEYGHAQDAYLSLVYIAESLIKADNRAFPERRIDGSQRNPV